MISLDAASCDVAAAPSSLGPEMNPSAKPDESPHLRCSDCSLTFDTKAKLKYHRLKTHGAWRGNITCSHCNKTYGTKSNLRRHQREAHGGERGGDEEGVRRGHACPHCPYAARDAFHLAVHVRKHTGERPFECSKCGFAFYKRSDLKVHASACGGARHRCEDCGAGFRFLRQWREHRLWSDGCGALRDKVDGVSGQKDGHDR